MSDKQKENLDRVEKLCSSIIVDSEKRLSIVDMLLRDLNINLDVLERRVKHQRRLDAVRLQERVHALVVQIDELLTRENPETTTALSLLLTKTILESGISLDDSRAVKAMADAYSVLVQHQPAPTPPKDVTL